MSKIILVIKEFKSLFFLFTIFIILTYIFLFFNKQNQINSNLDLIRKSYESDYNLIYKNFKNLSQNTYYGIINKPLVYNIYKNLNDDSRDKLYKEFLSDYNRLKEFNIYQVHFHTKDNKSFLRMHAPSKFGDDLTKIRDSIVKVNETMKPVEGFEMGRIKHGFRFVYPIFDENLIHLGSAEVSISSDFFEKSYETNFKSDLHFLLRKDIAKEKMFDNTFKKFKLSDENSDYIFHEENEKIHFTNNNFYNEKEKKFIKEKMDKGESFILNSNKNIVVYFKAISNISDIKNSAYLVIYSNSRYIELLENNYFVIYIVVLLIYIIFIFSLFGKYANLKKLTEQKELFNQQAKLASIGELINNIAHQWRQPLSIISTSASGIKLQKEYGILEEDTFNNSLDIIVEQSEKLSKTIDDFRNFTKDNKRADHFFMLSTINSCINLFESEISSKHLNIIKDIEDTDIISFQNELKQVISTILKNSIEYSKNNGIILITSKAEIDNIVITIQDSAGGIDKSIIKKVFEPYFTTNHQSQGKGLNLFVAYELTVNNLKGSLSVENKNFTFKFKNYTGACFILKIKKEL